MLRREFGFSPGDPLAVAGELAGLERLRVHDAALGHEAAHAQPAGGDLDLDVAGLDMTRWYKCGVSIGDLFDPANPFVEIDKTEMQQAVRNLVGNGIEVMPAPKGGKVTIRSTIPEAGWVRVDIADAGSGIPQDVLDKIFAPFFTTKARGTGLGLAVVRKVVDHHKGKVDVESTVGVGTTFKLYIPTAA